MQGKTIDNALLAMQGVPMPRVMPSKGPDISRPGVMRLLVMDALRGGSMTLRDVVAFVEPRQPELAPRRKD